MPAHCSCQFLSIKRLAVGGRVTHSQRVVSVALTHQSTMKGAPDLVLESSFNHEKTKDALKTGVAGLVSQFHEFTKVNSKQQIKVE